MKLRIREQSVRFRLSPDDVATLGRGEALQESLLYGVNGAFRYGLAPADIAEMCIDKEADGLIFLCPQPLITSLVETEEVGFEQEVGEAVELRLRVLVEKDFKCLIPRGEDDGNTFPNPNAEL